MNFLLYLTKEQTKQKEQIYSPTSWIITSKTPEKLSLIPAGFYIFYRFCSDPD